MLQAMRASPVAEHKLELQKFLGTTAGARMRRLMSQSAEEAGGNLKDLLDRLPPLDFYVPLTEDRMSWHGSDDLVVYSYLDDRDGSLRGFRVGNGRRVEIEGELESTLVALHPAEGKHLRIDPQPSVAGDVIQEPGDGTLSGSVTLEVDGETVFHSDLARLDESEYRSALRKARDLARPAAGEGTGSETNDMAPSSLESCGSYAFRRCEEDGGSGGGGSGVEVVLKRVGVTFCDNLNVGESNEIEFRSTASGVKQTARVEGVPCGSPSDFPDRLSPKVTNTALHSLLEFDTDIWETDGVLNGDDFAGGFNPDDTATPQGIDASQGDELVQATMGGLPASLDVDHKRVQSVAGLPAVGFTGLALYSVE